MSRLPDDLSLEDRRAYWCNYDKWCALFSRAEVDAQLMALSVHDIVDERAVPQRDWAGRSLPDRPPYGVHRALGTRTTHHRFVNEAGWERSESVPCSIYMVPAQYQSNAHTQVITAIMHERYPWLTQFKCNFYALNFYNSHTEEFYVRTAQEHGERGGHRSLYVPYAAFFARDVNTIIKRNEAYLKDYTRSDTTWSSMREDANVVAFLLLV